MFKQFLLFTLFLTVLPKIGFSQVDDSTYQEIIEVVITSDKPKSMVFEDPKYYIVDFTIADTHAILLMRNFSTYYLYELDRDMNFRHKLKLDVDADALFDDCFGNSYVITKDTAYFILNDRHGLFLTETHPRRQFINAMEKCAGTTSEKVVFEKKSNYNQDQTYYTVDFESGDRKIIYEMKDEELSRSMKEATAELSLMEYREKDRVAEGNTSASLKDDVNSQRIKNANYDRMKFVSSHVLRPKYNPLFAVDDTLYVFNHQEGKAEVMNDHGDTLNTIPINYHSRKNWDKKVYVDNVDKEFYAVLIRNGVQQLIRLSFEEDGQDSSSEITKHAYPKKVMIRDGYAYYTYKPNFDANLNKLYQQKL